MVSERHSALAKGLCRTRQRTNGDRAIQQGVLRMDVKVNEGHGAENRQ